jgi:hypothetical protein
MGLVVNVMSPFVLFLDRRITMQCTRKLVGPLDPSGLVPYIYIYIYIYAN